MHVFVRPEERSLETCNDGMIIRARTHAGGLYALLLAMHVLVVRCMHCMQEIELNCIRTLDFVSYMSCWLFRLKLRARVR